MQKRKNVTKHSYVLPRPVDPRISRKKNCRWTSFRRIPPLYAVHFKYSSPEFSSYFQLPNTKVLVFFISLPIEQMENQESLIFVSRVVGISAFVVQPPPRLLLILWYATCFTVSDAMQGFLFRDINHCHCFYMFISKLVALVEFMISVY